MDNCYCGTGSTSNAFTTTTGSITGEQGISFESRPVTVPGFVSVTEFDYYFMRTCMVIVLIGAIVVSIKAFLGIFMDCGKKKKVHSYGKVKYNTDVSDAEN